MSWGNLALPVPPAIPIRNQDSTVPCGVNKLAACESYSCIHLLLTEVVYKLSFLANITRLNIQKCNLLIHTDRKIFLNLNGSHIDIPNASL